MIEIGAGVSWRREDNAVFTDGRYSRIHTWQFDGGVQVPASSSPHIVPLPYSSAENVDPEEAYVASLSSCHMLVFLHLASKRGYVVDSYRDEAAGVMEKNEAGKFFISKVTLKPQVTYSGKAPDRETEEALHHEAHDGCFLANSVRTVIETRLDRAGSVSGAST